MIYTWIIVLSCISAAAFLTAMLGLLSWSGAFSGTLVALCVYAGGGLTGIALLSGFFLLGAAATIWKKNTKLRAGLAENAGHKGRSASQVWANGGIAAAAGLASVLFPVHRDMVMVMMASALASATADTLSSELGNVYGSKFYNILNFRADQRGENGVVSTEGTLIGLLGSALLALIYGLCFGHQQHFLFICIAGALGNLVDSVLGAVLERKNLIGNDLVNWLNTAAGAVAGGLLFMAFAR